ncbi:hypothetical protein ACSQ67_003068 [Phaseolus vulgaris]
MGRNVHRVPVDQGSFADACSTTTSKPIPYDLVMSFFKDSSCSPTRPPYKRFSHSARESHPPESSHPFPAYESKETNPPSPESNDPSPSEDGLSPPPPFEDERSPPEART